MKVVGPPAAMTGTGTKLKPANVAAPAGVVTDTLPEAPVPTTAVIVVVETTFIDAAAVPPKLTSVTPTKFVPVMVTVVPADAVVGVKDGISAAAWGMIF